MFSTLVSSWRMSKIDDDSVDIKPVVKNTVFKPRKFASGRLYESVLEPLHS
jgi:hypothetical protein